MELRRNIFYSIGPTRVWKKTSIDMVGFTIGGHIADPGLGAVIFAIRIARFPTANS